MGLAFCGKAVSDRDLSLIQQVVKTYGKLSRTELAHTVCELLEWRRENGRLKFAECRLFLERLEREQLIELPVRRTRRAKGSPISIPQSKRGEPGRPLTCELAGIQPVRIVRTQTPEQRALWRELIGRYHYLGHKVAFGAHIRYLIEGKDEVLLGGIQFSSPAWRMAARDVWLGWSDEMRAQRLQRIVNNSRFLILPWVQIKNLASHVLSIATQVVIEDWQVAYGLKPLFAETLVDAGRFNGTCYRAANWLDVGETTGRGRQDRIHQRHGAYPKRVFLYPLVKRAKQQLCQAGG